MINKSRWKEENENAFSRHSREFMKWGNKVLDNIFPYRTAMASISSGASLGRADTSTVDRAGGSAEKKPA